MTELQDISLKEQKVEIEIGGKTRTLLYDMFAFAELEKEYGDLAGVQAALGMGSIKSIMTMLRAGLLHEDENITIKEIGHGMNLRNLQDVVEKITIAIVNSLPQPEEGAESVGEPQETPLAS